MIALRVEHIDGRGPYHRGSCPAEQGWDGTDTRGGKRPTPCADNLTNYAWSDVLFAFSSYAQLLAWCDGEPPSPIEKYQLVLYHCPDCEVQIGGKQVVLSRPHAERLTAIPFTKVWEFQTRQNAASQTDAALASLPVLPF